MSGIKFTGFFFALLGVISLIYSTMLGANSPSNPFGIRILILGVTFSVLGVAIFVAGLFVEAGVSFAE